MTNRNSTLAPSTKPLKRSWIKRNTPLRHGNGTAFKLTADDKAQWKWMAKQRPVACDVCRYPTYSRCHLDARGSGGRVNDNVVWLCERHSVSNVRPLPGCHSRQEKRTSAFMAELEVEGNPVDLYAIAAAHTAQWRKETGRSICSR